MTPEQRRDLRRRLAPVVLLGGLAAAGAYGWRSTPHDNAITIRLEGDRSALARVEASVRGQGDEAIAGATWSFATDRAPPALRMSAKARRGDYALSVRAEFRDGSATSSMRRLRLDGDDVTARIALAGDLPSP
jgi:hypothetical protein